MDTGTWERIERIFLEALELAPESRAAHLDRACGDDPELRREIEEMLVSHGADGLKVERILRPEDGDGPDPALDLTGQRIGSWRLSRLLGQGGMGEVWLGERDDEFHQLAAVKLVRPGWRAAELVSRFRHERQILARLTHPGIATLLDGGLHEDGRPWLAMEYVDGAPVTDWCERRGLGIRDRLRLFRTICDAVRFAHANLVIHRDLKPANILVTDDGRPILLDFGIAKLLDPEDDGTDSAPTRPEERILTPEHAAPEQIRGEPVTTSTDVWALGVLLYELVTGQRPFRREGRSPADVERLVREQDPPPPSTVAPREVRRALRGDLDAIVQTALRKEPERRYESVEQFAEDIGRWLADLPVRARPDSVGYRVRKFLRRNAAPVAGVAAFALLLVMAAGVAGWQATRAARERDRAEGERAKSERVLQMLVDLFEASNPQIVPGGDTLRVSDFLDEGERKLAELEGQPEVQLKLWETMAAIHGARSRFDRQRAALDRALEASRSFSSGPDTLRILHLIARHVAATESHAAAEPLFRASLDRHVAQLGPEAPDVAIAAQDLAGVVTSQEERSELLKRALVIRRTDPGTEPIEIASNLNALGSFHWDRAEYQDARQCFRETLAILTTELAPEHPAVLSVRNNLAHCASVLGEFEDAERLHRELLEVRTRILGPETIPTAQSWQALGISLANQGRYEQSLAALGSAQRIFERRYDPAHGAVISGLRNCGLVLVRHGRADEGLALLDQAVRLTEEQSGAASEPAAYLRVQRSSARRQLGQPVESLKAELTIIRSTYPEGHVRIADALMAEGMRALAEGRADEAAVRFEEALAIRDRFVAPGHPQHAAAVLALAVARAPSPPETDITEVFARYASWGLSDPALIEAARTLPGIAAAAGRQK